MLDEQPDGMSVRVVGAVGDGPAAALRVLEDAAQAQASAVRTLADALARARQAGAREDQIADALGRPTLPLSLSARETEILELLCRGKSNSEIAVDCCLSTNTVKTVIRSLYRKLGVSSRTQAMRWASHHGYPL